MNPNDKLMIENLSNKIKSSHPVTKDPLVQELISNEIGSQPDSLYLLTQAVLLQEEAIKQLQQQVSEFQKCPNQKGGFLASVFGQKQRQSQPASYNSNRFGQGSFLSSALSSAVGVAGGMMLFNGISHLFSSNSHASNPSSESMFSSSPLVENITDNETLSDGFGNDDRFLSSSDDGGSSDGGWFDSGDSGDGGWD